MAVPYRSAARPSDEAPAEQPRLNAAVRLTDSSIMSSVIRTRAPLAAHADGRRSADRELAALGIGSAHGEPLLLDDRVVGVLTVEPAAAAAPHLLRQVAPTLAAALAQAWTRQSEQRRLAQAEVLGYSSMAYLRALPVDELKVDRSFARDATSDERAAAIVRSTLQLALDLEMSMVVDSVEDAATLTVLREWGCHVAQGYHIARPMPAGQFLSWLAEQPVWRPRGGVAPPAVPPPRVPPPAVPHPGGPA